MNLLLSIIYQIPRCVGRLIITHCKRLKSGEYTDWKNSSLSNKSYKNLSRGLLKGSRVVLQVQSEGSCCWELFSSIIYSGESQLISPGYAEQPNFAPKSIKKKNC